MEGWSSTKQMLCQRVRPAVTINRVCVPFSEARSLKGIDAFQQLAKLPNALILPLSNSHRSDRSASPVARGGGRSPRWVQRLPITSRGLQIHITLQYGYQARCGLNPAENSETPIKRTTPSAQPLTVWPTTLQFPFSPMGYGVRRKFADKFIELRRLQRAAQTESDRSHRRGGQKRHVSRSHWHQAS